MTERTLAFHGAARTVTGSRYLLTVGTSRTLIDCGLFQGHKELRELNWREPPFPPHAVGRVLLTHAHIDHSGALPRLVKHGFRGEIYCTPSTRELLRLLLLDSAKLQEEDARYANKKGYSKHKPALPLYDERDAKRALEQLEPIEYDCWLELERGVRVRYRAAGHILGASHLEVRLPLGNKREGTVVFSGDVGRYDMPLHIDPLPMPECEVLVCESTYGDRDHDTGVSVEEQLRDVLLPVIERRGTALIPAFAVGRSQQLTLILRDLMDDGRLPEVPIHLDSPMAVDATAIYSRYLTEHHLDPEVFEDGRSRLFPHHVKLHRSVAESKALNDLSGPRIIVSSSGMLTGGRAVHHLARLVTDPDNLVLMVGYQAAGTRGRKLLEGTPTIRMYGRDLPARAECAALHGLSAHADRSELLRWLTEAGPRPRKVFLTHGEPEASFAFAQTLRRELGLSVGVPNLDEEVDLDLFF